jgi:hypothetical protein
MGWKEFWASVVDSTAPVISAFAWPVAVLLIVLFVVQKFRPEIVKLLDRIKRAKGPGYEVDFGDLVDAAEETAERVIEDEEVPPAADSPPRGSVVEPVVAVIRAWEALVDDLMRLQSLTLGPTRYKPVLALSKLISAGVISDDAASAIQSLRKLRNEVAHGRASPTKLEADRFVDAARDMSRYIDNLIGQWNDRAEPGHSPDQPRRT